MVVHGEVLTVDTLAYLSEVALLQSLCVLHDWLAQSGLDPGRIASLVTFAGEYGVVVAVERWFHEGTRVVAAGGAPFVFQHAVRTRPG